MFRWHNKFASLPHLASLLYAQVKLDEALPLYRQALEIRRRTLGEEHPDVGIVL